MVISMDRWKGKVAVVTGASGGIGAAIAEHLVDAGLKVVGLARRNERVEEMAKRLKDKSGKLYALKTDVSKEEDLLQAFKWVKQNVGPVHILVNNAAIERKTSMMEGDTQKWKEVLDTNVLGLCVATREAVKDMRANNVDGHIIHINSIAGHFVPNFAGTNIYPASKHAVTALTETLRQELNSIGSKIKITGISPGMVETNLRDVYGTLAPEVEAMIKATHLLQSEDVADAVLYVLSTPPHVQVHDLMIRPIGEKI